MKPLLPMTAALPPDAPRRSGRHPVAANGATVSDEDSMTNVMRRQVAHNLDSAAGISPSKSFLSFSSSRISSNLNHLGVTMGKHVEEVGVLARALKHVEFDRLKISSKRSSPTANLKTEELEEVHDVYDGQLLAHLVNEVNEVGLDDERLGSMFCDLRMSSHKSKSHLLKKKQKPSKKVKVTLIHHERHVLEQQRSS